MKSISIYQIPDVLEVLVNHSYNLPCEDGCHYVRNRDIGLKDFLHNEAFEDSYVGYSDQRSTEVKEDIRTSKSCNVNDLLLFNGEENHNPRLDLHEKVKLLAPLNFRDCIKPLKYSGRCKVIQYLEGGFFKKHQDSIGSKYHFATVLVLIPARLSPHTGGTLRIWDENEQIHEFNTETMNLVTVVAFHPSLLHEVLPITSGKRVVFKYDLSYDQKLFYLLSAPKLENIKSQSVEDVIKQDLQDVTESAIESAKEFIKEMQKASVEWECTDLKGHKFDSFHGQYCCFCDETQPGIKELITFRKKAISDFKDELEECYDEMKGLSTLDRGESSYNHKSLFDAIEKYKYSEQIVIIRLINFYPQANEAFLYPIDLSLFEKLQGKYSDIGILNMSDDERMSYTDGKLSDYENSWSDYTDKVKILSMKYINTCNNTSYCYNDDDDSEDSVDEETKHELPTVSVKTNIGVRERRSVYNDSTYDTEFNNAYTCFIIKL